jgi:hypothetical protein
VTLTKSPIFKFDPPTTSPFASTPVRPPRAALYTYDLDDIFDFLRPVGVMLLTVGLAFSGVLAVEAVAEFFGFEYAKWFAATLLIGTVVYFR